MTHARVPNVLKLSSNVNECKPLAEGKVPRVLVSPTVHDISTEGTIKFLTGVQVAHLALKHRQNKLQR